MNHKIAIQYLLLILTVFMIYASFSSANVETITIDSDGIKTPTGEIESRPIMYVVGLFLCVMLLVQLFLIFKRKEDNLVVEKDDAIEYVSNEMYQKRKISVPEDYHEHFYELTNTHHRFVFAWTDEDTHVDIYLPVEVNKYYQINKEGALFIEMGHTLGLTDNLTRVNEFILRHMQIIDPSAAVRVLNGNVEDLIDGSISSIKDGDK